jgi:polyisoprenoid-binding protein YceI
MERSKRLRATTAIVTGFVGMGFAAATAHAALSTASDAKVAFEATGPGGMKIDGTTADLTVADDGTTITVTVPLTNLSTGIGLRDKHMKEKYLEVDKYPNAVLTIPRAGLKIPHAGEQAAADVGGTVQIHGQTRPVTVHYDARGDGSTVAAHGAFRVNMNEFGITVPVYLGVTVKPDVDVSASFKVAGG